MMHLHLKLPTSIANGARKRDEWEFETIRKVGGGEVRNELWSEPLRVFDLPFPPMKEGDSRLAAMRDIWRATGGGLHSFDFDDTEVGDTVRVRFDGDYQVNHVEGPWHQVETLVLREVRD